MSLVDAPVNAAAPEPAADDGAGQDLQAGMDALAREIEACTRCPRLIDYCREIARVKRRAYRDQTYWGKPVPGFGDVNAKLLVVGLAPGAHGANRTGRMFTGDSSGDWLYRAMYRAGFASQPTSRAKDDGLRLIEAYVTAAGRCAPPENKMTAGELAACRPFLERELALLPRVRVVLCLGKVAFDTYLKIVRSKGIDVAGGKAVFAHGATYEMTDGKLLIASYHPSRQNTQTGRLTEAMLDHVFRIARDKIDGSTG